MNRAKQILEFGKILERLSECTVSEKVKAQALGLEMILNEKILKDKIKETILSYFEMYKQGSLKVYPVELNKYSRKNLTQELAKHI